MSDMRRILIAWELGQGLGHISGFPALALALRERGHEVGFALRELMRAEPVLGRHAFPLLQAPVWLGSASGLPLAASYAEILPRVGYADVDALTGLLRGWRALFDLWKPDVVLFNHAPTAVLASLGASFKRVLFGTGFECPEARAQSPRFSPWTPVPEQRLLSCEDRILVNLNAAIRRLGLAPVDGLDALVAVDERLLFTWPELDPYSTLRAEAEYRGSLMGDTGGDAAAWPSVAGPRVFAYVKTGYPHLESLLAELGRRRLSALAYVSGLRSGQAEHLSTRSLRVSTHPLRLAELLADCHGLICHGGHGTIAASLAAGVPVLSLPLHVENWINGSRLAATGAGLMPATGTEAPDFMALLNRLVGDSALRQRASEIAACHAPQDRVRQVADAVERIEARCSKTQMVTGEMH